MKKIIILAFFAAGLQWAAAQNTGYYEDPSLTASGLRGIIRENQIAYYKDGTTGYFAYIPSFNNPLPATLTQYYRIPLPTKWSVRDFRVLNGKVYFCGTDLSNYTALFGYFDISNLVYGTGSVNFHRDANIASQLSVLNRIAVKTDKRTTSVMAIGNEVFHENPETTGSDRVLYIDDFTANTGGVFYSPDLDEVFWDVVSTDSYFAVTGKHKSDSNTLTLRRVPFGTTVSNFQPLFGDRYLYHCAHQFKGGVRAAALGGDTIATAIHYCYDSTVSSMIYHNYGYQISTILVPNAQMLYNQWSRTSTLDKVDFSTLRDMVYMKDSASLMLIDTFPYLYEGGVVRLDPYPNTFFYSPQYFFRDTLFQETIYHHVLSDTYDTITTSFPKSDLSPYNSLAVLSSKACVASAGDRWLVLDFNALPRPLRAYNCVGSYTIDMFTFPRIEPMLEMIGIVNPYNMRFEDKICDGQNQNYTYCVPNPSVIISVYNK